MTIKCPFYIIYSSVLKSNNTMLKKIIILKIKKVMIVIPKINPK